MTINKYKFIKLLEIEKIDKWTSEFIAKLCNKRKSIDDLLICRHEGGKCTFVRFNTNEVKEYIDYIKKLNNGWFIRQNKKLTEHSSWYFDCATMYDEYLSNPSIIKNALRTIDPDKTTNIRSANYINNVGVWYLLMLSEFLTNDNERVKKMERHLDCHIIPIINILAYNINTSNKNNNVFKFIKSNLNWLKHMVDKYKLMCTSNEKSHLSLIYEKYSFLYEYALSLKHVRLNTSAEIRVQHDNLTWSYILTTINWLIYDMLQTIINPFNDKELNLNEFWALNPRQ